MEISKSIRKLLLETNKKQSDLIGVLNCKTRQAVNGKLANERWFASDLVKVAEYCGAELAFILPDGTHIPIK